MKLREMIDKYNDHPCKSLQEKHMLALQILDTPNPELINKESDIRCVCQIRHIPYSYVMDAGPFFITELKFYIQIEEDPWIPLTVDLITESGDALFLYKCLKHYEEWLRCEQDHPLLDGVNNE